jgi:hypothetical protein
MNIERKVSGFGGLGVKRCYSERRPEESTCLLYTFI